MRITLKSLQAAVPFAVLLTVTSCNSQPADTDTTRPETPLAAVPDAASDEAIVIAVRAKYYTDEELRGRPIDVSAQNGVVTLKGSVENQAAKTRAESLAQGTASVSRVQNEIHVAETVATTGSAADSKAPASRVAKSGRQPDDSATLSVATKIRARYFLHPDLKRANIDVSASDSGMVTLEGSVPTDAMKQEAVKTALGVDGVMQVKDRLAVDGKTSPSPAAGGADPDRADWWLTTKVQGHYFLDEDVKARNIEVSTKDGVVTLKGNVESESERRQAIAIARNTDGVRDVVDQLGLDPTLQQQADAPQPLPGVKPIPRPDAWITMKIQAQYFLDDDVKGHQIDVDTNAGTVTLQGQVGSEQQKREAEQIARETEGVSRVVNELTVAAGTTSSPQ